MAAVGIIQHAQEINSTTGTAAIKGELVQRLGQYEDTGLTPEEIRELRREDNRYQTFNPD